MKILHLAYQDPKEPGAGGGSKRTYEVNRRLAKRHQVVAIVSGYQGSEERVEEGVRYVPIGLGSGRKIDRLTYFALLRRAIKKNHPFDLLVDDFGAPISVSFSPLFTDKPVVASVQWMFASEMRHKYYGIPFDWVERCGLRYYDDFIVLSDWLGEKIRVLRPNAVIETIPSGFEPENLAVKPDAPRHLLFVGRLDVEQKGCDLLLEAMSILRQRMRERTPNLLIVGDGPGEDFLRKEIRERDLGDLVQLEGRVDGADKFKLMASAYAVLMPSRFETFGMVSVEAQAAGAPVVAFDIGPLREVCGPGGACLVQPFNLHAYIDQVQAIITNSHLFGDLRIRGKRWAERYNWDEIASQQERHYVKAVEAWQRAERRR